MKKSLILILFLIAAPNFCFAVIPPDFIFSMGSQIIQFFAIMAAFLSGLFLSFFQYLKVIFTFVKSGKIFFLLSLLIILLSGIGAVGYSITKQNEEYNKWLAESQRNNEDLGIENMYDRSIEVQIPKNQILAQKAIAVKKNNNLSIKKINSFYNENKNNDLAITNLQLKKVFNSDNDDYFILDAREDVEFGYGRLKDSHHIRFADLKAGKWRELPKDKFVYVLCWSGMRGKETAEFLRSKGVVASYLKDGAKGWVDFGGEWIGEINFFDYYKEMRYRKIYTTEEVLELMDKGVMIIDSRELKKFELQKIEGSISIPIMHTPSSELEDKFNQLPPNSKVLIVCDDYVNCFDAKLTGVELEKRGHEFLGRYNKPWEFYE